MAEQEASWSQITEEVGTSSIEIDRLAPKTKNSIEIPINFFECDEPEYKAFYSRPQCLSLDFTPDPDVDNENTWKKCHEFWKCVEARPELQAMEATGHVILDGSQQTMTPMGKEMTLAGNPKVEVGTPRQVASLQFSRQTLWFWQNYLTNLQDAGIVCAALEACGDCKPCDSYSSRAASVTSQDRRKRDMREWDIKLRDAPPPGIGVARPLYRDKS